MEKEEDDSSFLHAEKGYIPMTRVQFTFQKFTAERKCYTLDFCAGSCFFAKVC